MGYARDRRVLTVKSGPTVSDNVDVAHIIIPANKEVEVFAFRVLSIVANGTASGKMELVKADNTIIASATNTHTASTIADATQTMPLTVAASTSDTFFKIRTDQAIDGSGICHVEVHFAEMGYN